MKGLSFLELYEKIAMYFENREALSQQDIMEVESLTEEELIEQFKKITGQLNQESIADENNEVFITTMKNNMKTLMFDGRVWRFEDIKKSLSLIFQDLNGNWVQDFSTAINQLVAEEPNLIEISKGVYQYKMNEKFQLSIESIENAKNCVISIGEDINPITATEADMNTVAELKKVIQKLEECKKIIERLK